jgi:hypothetical protein
VEELLARLVHRLELRPAEGLGDAGGPLLELVAEHGWEIGGVVRQRADPGDRGPVGM